MEEKKINIVLLEDIPFNELIIKLEKVFNTSLPYKNEKGRLIGRSEIDDFKISVIDRYDDLSEILCDEHHTLEITITYTGLINYEKHESEIKGILNNIIKWEYGIWSPIKKGDAYRKVYPQKETELFL